MNSVGISRSVDVSELWLRYKWLKTMKCWMKGQFPEYRLKFEKKIYCFNLQSKLKLKSEKDQLATVYE